MSRYIDKDKALEFVLNNTPHINGETTMECVERAIREIPTADVVEVVRCRDCKFATEYCHGDYECRCPHTPWASDEYAIPCNANDFCSYGERREG